MALIRLGLVLLALLSPSIGRAQDAKLYDGVRCAEAIVAAFRPLLAQRRVGLVEPPRAAMRLIATAERCPIDRATRARARDLAGRGEAMLSPMAVATPPTRPWLAELSYGYGLPRASGPSRKVLLDAIDAMLAHSLKLIPLAQALFVMANFEYRGPESPDGVPIVGDVLLGTLAPGCGYGEWFDCDEPRMDWSTDRAARVRRWYVRRYPRSMR